MRSDTKVRDWYLHSWGSNANEVAVRFRGSHSDVAADSNLLECDTVVGWIVLTFIKFILPSSWGLRNLSEMNCLTLQKKALWSLKTPGVTVSDVTEYLNLQQQSFENQNSCIVWDVFILLQNSLHINSSVINKGSHYHYYNLVCWNLDSQMHAWVISTRFICV
jgi:hypothetical protein